MTSRTIGPRRSDSPRTYVRSTRIIGVSGTQIHLSCCSGVFVNQSAESVAAVELVWRAWIDEA
jgi:hypothetical protein